MSADLTRYKRIPLDKLKSVAGKDLVQIFRDHWWILDQDNNTLWARGEFPQCNSNQKIAESILERLYDGLGFSVKLVAVAYIPISCLDFSHEP